MMESILEYTLNEVLYLLNVFDYTNESNILSRVYLIAGTGNVVNFYKSDVKSCTEFLTAPRLHRTVAQWRSLN